VGDSGFFPLDKKLRLRRDHNSEGAARVAVRMALTASSFGQAAEDYREATGGRLSRMGVWRRTMAAGHRLAERKRVEAERAAAPAQVGEGARSRRVAEERPIGEQGNVSSDGTMILVREEGWKEVKMSAFSEVSAEAPRGHPRPDDKRRPSRRDFDIRIALHSHSYTAGLWDADEFARYQYAEGLRRGLDHVPVLSSVNDGAHWIRRVTADNFPRAQQIVDWAHATRRLHQVARAVWGEGEQEKRWVSAQLEELWRGRVERVIRALQQLDRGQRDWPEEVGDPVGYFMANADRMRYDWFRSEGYPIGSGTVESGAQSVVQVRMRCPGRGWSRRNANGMLALLSEHRSRRFNKAWQALREPVH